MIWVEKVNRYFSAKSVCYQKKSESGLWSKIRAQESSKILNALELQPQDTVLEVGCGSGYYSLLIQDKVSQLMSIDSNPAMIAVANNSGVNAELAEVADTENHYFDKILIAGVLEFALKPSELVKTAQKKLKRGGVLVILHPRGGVIGLGYQWFHQLRGCPVHTSHFISKIFSAKGWRFEKAGPLAWCSVWQNNG